jgi:hypothetical protein
MKVRYVKCWIEDSEQIWLTIGKEYNVIKIDEDGDYWVLDDNRNKAVLLPSEIEILKHEA